MLDTKTIRSIFLSRNMDTVYFANFIIETFIKIFSSMTTQHCVVVIIEKILISVSIIKFAMYMKTVQFLFTARA